MNVLQTCNPADSVDTRKVQNSGIARKAKILTNLAQSKDASKTLKFKNFHYEERAERVDLISHDLHQFSAQLGSNNYCLGDVSAWGFSYAQKIPVKTNDPFSRIKSKLHTKFSPLLGKQLPFSLLSEQGDGQRNLQVNGTIRNFRFFFLIPCEEVEKVIKRYLYRKGFSSIKDPQNHYARGIQLIEKAKVLKDSGQWDSSGQISLNISMMYFLEELGALDYYFEDLWIAYGKQPLFVKFGVFVEEEDQALKMLEFTGLSQYPKGIKPEVKELMPQPKILPQQSKQDLYKKANQLYRSGPLLSNAWKSLIKLYHLNDDSSFPKRFEIEFKSKIEKEICLPLEEIFGASAKSVHLNINKIMATELVQLMKEKSGLNPPPISSVMRNVLQVKLKIFNKALEQISNPLPQGAKG